MTESQAHRWLTIRADATPATGAGHVMRCLSVAEQWQDLGGEAEIWGEVTLGFVAARAHDHGISLLAQPQIRGNDLLLVDVYGDAERRRLAKQASHRLRILVDDLMIGDYREFDAVWNPNAYGERKDYSDGPATVLAGEDFVPIRADLPRWSGDGQGGAVAFGGGAMPARIAELAASLPSMTGEHSGWSIADPPPAGWQRADARDPWGALHRARWLVMGAGSMLWEAAAVGIPVVVCIVADNQVHAAGWAQRHGAAVLDLRGDFEIDGMRAQLVEAVERARPLPPLTSGARRVARRFWEL